MVSHKNQGSFGSGSRCASSQRQLQALTLALLERGARGLATGGTGSSGLAPAAFGGLPRFAGLSFGASTDLSFGVTSAMPLAAASATFCKQQRETRSAAGKFKSTAPGKGGGGGFSRHQNYIYQKITLPGNDLARK